jgi:hypothetical protein
VRGRDPKVSQKLDQGTPESREIQGDGHPDTGFELCLSRVATEHLFLVASPSVLLGIPDGPVLDWLGTKPDTRPSLYFSPVRSVTSEVGLGVVATVTVTPP